MKNIKTKIKLTSVTVTEGPHRCLPPCHCGLLPLHRQHTPSLVCHRCCGRDRTM